MASWWSVLEDILYPEKKIQDRIRRRADSLAEARFDSVMQFGFHTRFDYVPYFGALHAYHAAVAEELHKRDIRFFEHFSCNVIARPRGREERLKYHRWQRHHVALYPDEEARRTLTYEGHRLDSLRAVTVASSLPSYAPQYQCEFLCHNNPEFREMNQKYLKRYLAEVPIDGIEVDDMVYYDGFQSCGCRHCRDRFREEYGRVVPGLDDHGFWGDTSKSPYDWGNYENPDFLSWVQMRFDATTEHFALIRQAVGDKLPLTTCSSNTGPILLNSLGMRYESLAGHMGVVMLENNGIDVSAADWTRTEPEAMLQKSYARSHGNLPVVALSYANCEDGAYLGWAIARFWGVSNWTSTLTQGLPEDPPQLEESASLVRKYNRWDIANGDLDARGIRSPVDAFLAFDRHCKENGCRLPDGRDAWDRVSEWSKALLARNIAYQFIREDTLGSCREMLKLGRPIILESCAFLPDAQVGEIAEYARRGGRLIISGALGTHDERGRRRAASLLDALRSSGPLPNVIVTGTGAPRDLLEELVGEGHVRPCIVMDDPEPGFVARLHVYAGSVVLHLVNTRLEGIPHETVREVWPTLGPMLAGLRSRNRTETLATEIDFGGIGHEPWVRPTLRSPEMDGARPLELRPLGGGRYGIRADVSRIRLYAMVADGA
jgi:hypothetical protein